MSDAKKVIVNNVNVNFKDEKAREDIDKITDGFYAGMYDENSFYRLTDDTEFEKKANCVYFDVSSFTLYTYKTSTSKFVKSGSVLVMLNTDISSFDAFVNYSYFAYLNKTIYFYNGVTSSYMTHGYIYESVVETVTPTGSENPRNSAWLEHVSDDNYTFTNDRAVNNSKTYYTIKLKSIKTFDETFTPELKEKLEKIHNGYYIGKYVDGDLVDIASGNALPKTANWYYLDILTRTLYQYVGSSFVKVHNSLIDIIENIDTEAKMKNLAMHVFENNMSIRYMGPTSTYLTHGYFYEVVFEPFMIPVTTVINPVERDLYEMDSNTGTYHKSTDTEVDISKVYFEAILEPLYTQPASDPSVVESRVAAIESKIPSNASSSNKLVTTEDIYDKDDLVVKSNVAGLIRNDGSIEEDYLTSSDIGTAAAKDYTSNVSPNNHALVESNAVYSAISNAISTVFKPRGNITVAELTSTLLTSEHKDELYSVTDTGTTTADFIGGAGKTINAGDTVTIVNVGPDVYKFNLSPGMFHLDRYQEKTIETPITIGNTSGLDNIESILATLASIVPSTASSAKQLLTDAALIPYVHYTRTMSTSYISDTDRQNAILTLLNNYHLVDDKGMGCASVAYGNLGIYTYIMMREKAADTYPAYATVLEMRGSDASLSMVRAAKDSGGNWYILTHFVQYLRSNQVQGSGIEGSTLPVASGALYNQGIHNGSLAKNDCLDVELRGNYIGYIFSIQVAGGGGRLFMVIHDNGTTSVRNLWSDEKFTSTRGNATTIENGITITNMASNKDRIRNANNETELIWVSGPISRVEFVESQDISG